MYFLVLCGGKNGIWTVCFRSTRSCSIWESIAVSEVSAELWLSPKAVSLGYRMMPLVLVSLLLDDPCYSLIYILIRSLEWELSV